MLTRSSNCAESAERILELRLIRGALLDRLLDRLALRLGLLDLLLGLVLGSRVRRLLQGLLLGLLGLAGGLGGQVGREVTGKGGLGLLQVALVVAGEEAERAFGAGLLLVVAQLHRVKAGAGQQRQHVHQHVAGGAHLATEAVAVEPFVMVPGPVHTWLSPDTDE